MAVFFWQAGTQMTTRGHGRPGCIASRRKPLCIVAGGSAYFAIRSAPSAAMVGNEAQLLVDSKVTILPLRCRPDWAG
jgi:hypothetical protein